MKTYYTTLCDKWQGRRWIVEWNWQRCVIGFQWSRWIPAVYLGPISIGYDRKPD